jgi:peptidyl-prolyl cis-trans isomerase SurA
MLKTINIKKAIIAITVVAALAAAPAGAGILLDRVVAVVNDEAITWSELYGAMEFEMARNMKSLSVEQKKAVFEENESAFLEQMINVKLQLQEAKRLGITAGDREVDAAIEGIKAKYSLSDEQFEEAIAGEGMEMQQYREKLREQLVINKVLDVRVRSKLLAPDEGQEDGASDDAYLRLRQIFIAKGPGAAEKAEAVMAELEAGADFVELVGKYSEGPLAASGGDLGRVQKSSMVREFASAISGLGAGEVAGPFETSRGIHIVRVEENTDMEDEAAERRFMEAYSDWLRSLREKSFIEIRL